jgi:hypothetical protein
MVNGAHPTLERQPARRCEATNKAGEPCRSTSVDAGGFCAVHGGKVDMRELGSRGGRQSVRSRLSLDHSVADDRLRAKAKRRLEALLDSDDESKRLSAARALYSYSAVKPPNDEESKNCECARGGWCSAHGYQARHREPFKVVDVLKVFLLDAEGILDDPEIQRIVIEAYTRIPDVQRPAEVFTEQVARAGSRAAGEPTQD